jgi:hypothetical protein
MVTPGRRFRTSRVSSNEFEVTSPRRLSCEERTRLRAVSRAIRKRSAETGRCLRVEGRRRSGGPPPARGESDASSSPRAGVRELGGDPLTSHEARDPLPTRGPRRHAHLRWIEAPFIVQASLVKRDRSRGTVEAVSSFGFARESDRWTRPAPWVPAASCLDVGAFDTSRGFGELAGQRA